mmetsp:Transcript_28315/g.50156  ORF Transcript_28315/g.50156 Transcript_28315/m.50156 type:complete len:85 (-) Transcript_28315:237-491(-)
MGRRDWSPTLHALSHYHEAEVLKVANAILKAREQIRPELKSLEKKYSKSKYGKVSSITLASVDKPNSRNDFSSHVTKIGNDITL